MAPSAMTLMSVFFSTPSNLSLDDEPSDASVALAAAGEGAGVATGRASSGLRGAGTLSLPHGRGLRALACLEACGREGERDKVKRIRREKHSFSPPCALASDAFLFFSSHLDAAPRRRDAERDGRSGGRVRGGRGWARDERWSAGGGEKGRRHLDFERKTTALFFVDNFCESG